MIHCDTYSVLRQRKNRSIAIESAMSVPQINHTISIGNFIDNCFITDCLFGMIFVMFTITTETYTK
ncbi:hypothetical protein XBKB1_1040001 [Xenorhabdus bovienii str. kraussei Becker Underwood]|uniref:Uncharacterized protein n=1 Tax=Xenorhabdus bovienii str. kraussei Becker Underwood TaxID=1398204 RepID=A0A077PMI4_XENBV|nr:hypothetical protein XBKB1_1040001 [Xenorhabdus bovienii str. kraussei Becker Underwood]